LYERPLDILIVLRNQFFVQRFESLESQVPATSAGLLSVISFSN